MTLPQRITVINFAIFTDGGTVHLACIDEVGEERHGKVDFANESAECSHARLDSPGDCISMVS